MGNGSRRHARARQGLFVALLSPMLLGILLWLPERYRTTVVMEKLARETREAMERLAKD